jgi:arsenite methyltransferase
MMALMVRVLDPMFARPRGVLGKVGGRIMARTNVEVERTVVELAHLKPGESVLVVGPGPGIGLRLAAERTGAVTTGVEPSATMRAQATQHCLDLVRQGRVVIRDGDAARTGAAQASADVVISVNNVMFWPDRAAGLAEFHRVLRPGGRLVIATHEAGLRFVGIDVAGLAAEVDRAGFEQITTNVVEHASIMGRGVELLARRA